MKSLKQAAQDYIQRRRHLGFKMRHEERRLRRFVSFMEQQKASYITTYYKHQIQEKLKNTINKKKIEPNIQTHIKKNTNNN